MGRLRDLRFRLLRSQREVLRNLQAVYERGDTAEGLRRATEILSGRYREKDKYEALHALLTLHPDGRHVAELLEKVKGDFPKWRAPRRLVLALHEFRTLGRSDLLATLPRRQTALYQEACRYFEAHPLQSEIARADQLLTGPSSASLEECVDLTLDALNRGDGYSLLRMGDGEGRFVISEPAMPEHARQTRKVAKTIWFWNSRVFPGDEFWHRLRAAYASASIVAPADRRRLAFEEANSMLGYIGVVNGNRHLYRAHLAGTGSRHASWTPDYIVRRILSGGDRDLTFIGPHPGIAPGLKALGAGKVDIRLVPGCSAVPNAVRTPHYPDVFQTTIEGIRKDMNGLCLIAAGPYAKIYADEVRKAGGVGIDVGSWANTRI